MIECISKLPLAVALHLLKELPPNDSILAVHANHSREDPGFLNHSVLGLEDFDDLLLMQLFVSVEPESRENPPELESLIELCPHDLSRLAFSQVIDIVPPTVENPTQPTLFDLSLSVSEEVRSIFDRSPCTDTTLLQHVGIVIL